MAEKGNKSYYLQLRIIEPLEIRGTATRYGRDSLLRVLGIMRLKGVEDSTIAEKTSCATLMTS